MPIHQLAPPSLTEVSLSIASFEERFRMTTAEFLEDGEVSREVPEDDAVEWLYLLEQRAALLQSGSVHPYSRTDRPQTLRNRPSVLDRLAA